MHSVQSVLGFVVGLVVAFAATAVVTNVLFASGIHPGATLVLLGVGLQFTLLGGFVSGVVAGRAEFQLSIALFATWCLLFFLVGVDESVNALYIAGAILGTPLGGYAAKRFNERRRRASKAGTAGTTTPS